MLCIPRTAFSPKKEIRQDLRNCTTTNPLAYPHPDGMFECHAYHCEVSHATRLTVLHFPRQHCTTIGSGCYLPRSKTRGESSGGSTKINVCRHGKRSGIPGRAEHTIYMYIMPDVLSMKLWSTKSQVLVADPCAHDLHKPFFRSAPFSRAVEITHYGSAQPHRAVGDTVWPHECRHGTLGRSFQRPVLVNRPR